MIYETNGQLNAWWQRRLGSYVIEAEIELLAQFLPTLFSKRVVLLGCSEQMRLLSTSDAPYQYILNKTISTFTAHRGIRASWDSLPFLDNSVEMMLVPHMLEMLSEETQVVFSEIFRVLQPEGHLFVLGFNPSQLWRLWRKCYPHDCPIPWLAHCHKRGDLRFSLSSLDYRIVAQKTVLHQLPTDDRFYVRWLNRFFCVVKKCFPSFGGVYLLHAQKQSVGVTPIPLSWRQKMLKINVVADIAPTQRTKVGYK